VQNRGEGLQKAYWNLSLIANDQLPYKTVIIKKLTPWTDMQKFLPIWKIEAPGMSEFPPISRKFPLALLGCYVVLACLYLKYKCNPIFEDVTELKM
jgi:hypothetical protein